ncbi:MAG: hypothetical protein JSU61_01755, partial [Fidelibacterota bacterium]
MTDSRRAIIAFILIAGVLLLTPKYIRWLTPEPERPMAPSEEVVPRPDTLPTKEADEVPTQAEYKPEPRLLAPAVPV